jgi:hypothetical protein
LKSATKVVLFTLSFPYGKGEAFLKNYFPSYLNEITSKIKARKSYISLWDYSLLALLKRKTPLKEWIHFYYRMILGKI